MIWRSSEKILRGIFTRKVITQKLPNILEFWMNSKNICEEEETDAPKHLWWFQTRLDVLCPVLYQVLT